MVHGDGLEHTNTLVVAFSHLPADALASQVTAGLIHYDHASSYPGGLDEMTQLLATDTPPLAHLRTEFRAEYLPPRLDGSYVNPLTTEAAVVRADEFDITLLAFYYTQALRKPLKELGYPHVLADHFCSLSAITEEIEPIDTLTTLEGARRSLKQLVQALGQSAFTRAINENVTDAETKRQLLAGPPHAAHDLSPNFVHRQWAHQVIASTFAAALDAMAREELKD